MFLVYIYYCAFSVNELNDQYIILFLMCDRNKKVIAFLDRTHVRFCLKHSTKLIHQVESKVLIHSKFSDYSASTFLDFSA